MADQEGAKASFVDAISTLFTLQRWNDLPRLETWVEAENAAYVAHLAYAVGRSSGMDNDDMEALLARSLLKSFRKHHLSDVSIGTRKAIGPNAWQKVEEGALQGTVSMFPEEVQDYVRDHLSSYPLTTDEQRPPDKLLRLVSMEVAISECECNKEAYSGRQLYQPILEELRGDQGNLSEIDAFRSASANLRKSGYFNEIQRLKYLRRWNRINRAIATSVMSHTFVVAALAMVASQLELADGTEHEDDFSLRCVLRALFHDVPEIYTGDVITPVKNGIVQLANIEWDDIEKKAIAPLREAATQPIRDDFERYGLLKELDDDASKDYCGALVKQCDHLALLLECLFERQLGRLAVEMDSAFSSYARELLRSDFSSIRELTVEAIFGAGGSQPTSSWV